MTEATINKIYNLMYNLLDKEFITEEDKEVLDVLGDIISEYETGIVIPDIYGIELLRCLIEDRGVTDEHILNLANKEALSKEDIYYLANLFNVDYQVFLPKQ